MTKPFLDFAWSETLEPTAHEIARWFRVVHEDHGHVRLTDEAAQKLIDMVQAIELKNKS